MPRRPHFVKTIAWALSRRCGLARLGKGFPRPPGRRVLVAVSGGADSVALIGALLDLAPRPAWRLELAVGHVQHHLRPQAESDAAFVAQLAQRFDVPFFRADLDLSQPKGNLESCARRGRYGALASMAARFGAGYLVTAHQADDQLETVLMRLLRGSSVQGLSGISWRRRLMGFEGHDDFVSGVTPQASAPGSAGRPGVKDLWLLRPMLAVDRAAVVEYLRGLNQPWCEDHTNADVSRTRARLRHEVLGVLKALRPDAAVRSVLLGDHLREVSQFLDRAVDRAVRRCLVAHEPLSLDRRVLGRMDRAVQSGLLRRMLLEAGLSPDGAGQSVLRPLIEAVRRSGGEERIFQLAGGVRVVLDAERVRIVPGGSAIPTAAPGSSPVSG